MTFNPHVLLQYLIEKSTFSPSRSGGRIDYSSWEQAWLTDDPNSFLPKLPELPTKVSLPQHGLLVVNRQRLGVLSLKIAV